MECCPGVSAARGERFRVISEGIAVGSGQHLPDSKQAPQGGIGLVTGIVQEQIG